MPKTHHRPFESREQTHPFYTTTTLPDKIRSKKTRSTSHHAPIVKNQQRTRNISPPRSDIFADGGMFYNINNNLSNGQLYDIPVKRRQKFDPNSLRDTSSSASLPAVNGDSISYDSLNVSAVVHKIGSYRLAARLPAAALPDFAVNDKMEHQSTGPTLAPPHYTTDIENGITRPTSSTSSNTGRARASPVEIIDDHHHQSHPTALSGAGDSAPTTVTTASSGSSNIGSTAAGTAAVPTTDHDIIGNNTHKRPSSFYGIWPGRRRHDDHHIVSDERPPRKGFWVSMAQAIIALCILLALLALVGLIVGLVVGAACRRSHSVPQSIPVPGEGVIYESSNSDSTPSSITGFGAAGSAADGIKPVGISSGDPVLAALFAEDASADAKRGDKLLRDIRLPDNVMPVHYNLELYPQLDPVFRFDGHVEIDLHVQRETREIVLHASKLLQVDTNDVRLTRLAQPTSVIIVTNSSNELAGSINNDTTQISVTPKGVPVRVERIEQDLPREFFRVHLSEALQPGVGEYRLFLKFSGNLTDDLKGIYRSSYKNSDGKIVWLMASQMQSTDARKVFPLFDEPALKATFEVTLVHDSRYSSIANMELIRQEPREDGIVADVYNTSVPMSSYLLAFVLSDFKYREAVSDRGTKLRIWARPNAIQQVDYAMDFTKKVLNYFEDYFQIPFPLSKLDQIAVPDFSAGAMENWGLIIYRETSLLFDPQTGSVNNKQRIATVIAHELAHQWFGNLVSPKWWDDLWLNEGFASYVEYVGQDYAHPDWKVMQQFVANDMQQTLKADSLVTSHPISLPVYNPDEISEIFDSISYGKGAALIRMMRYFLGEDTMRRGLNQYLRNFTYKAATQDDLWWHLTEAAHDAGLQNIDVKNIMDSWTLQMGYPVVTISRSFNDDGVMDKGKVHASQQHFLINPLANVLLKSPYNYTWNIPLTIVSQKDADFQEFERSGQLRVKWLTTKNLTITGLAVDENDWLLANILETGYYRVNYDDKNWYLLSRQLKQARNEIHVINRAQLVDDALALAQASLLPYNVALDVVDYLIKEQEYLPWEAAFSSFNYLDDMLRSSPNYGLLQRYMLKQLQPVFMSLGWTEDPNDSILTQKLRVDVISAACYYGLDECIHNAKRQFRAWMADPPHNPIANNLKTAVYCTAIRDGSVHEWSFAWNEYKTSNVASEQTKLLYAMSCSKEPWILSKYLQHALDETDIKRQDASKVISYVAGSSVGKYLAWPFFINNYDTLRQRFGSSFFSFASMVKELTEDINSEYAFNELKDFVKAHRHELATGKRAFKQSIERAEANLRWMSKNADTIVAWLRLNSGET